MGIFKNESGGFEFRPDDYELRICGDCRAEFKVVVGEQSGTRCRACVERDELRERRESEWASYMRAIGEVDQLQPWHPARLPGYSEDEKRRHRVDGLIGWNPSGEKRLMFVHGISFVGKTRTCWRLCRRLYVDSGLETLHVAPGMLPQLVLAGVRDRTLEQLMAKFSRAGVLFIDDVEKGKFTPSAREFLWAVLNARCQAHRATLITSNMTVEQFIAQFDDADQEPLRNRMKHFGYDLHL